eukprot:m.115032 g.115032  ORF g.115032 m.115032 type:complete len:540 (+) comp14188_c0_seq3:338-1957(+)
MLRKENKNDVGHVSSVAPFGMALDAGIATCVASTPAMERTFSAHTDGSIHEWDWYGTINGSASRLPCQIVRRPGWSIPLVKSTARHEKDYATCMHLHREAVWMLTGTARGALRLFSIRMDKGQCQHYAKHHRSSVQGLAVPESNQVCVTGSKDGTICVVDLNTGASVGTRNPQPAESRAGIQALHASSEDNNVFLGLWDTGAVTMWDVRQANFSNLCHLSPPSYRAGVSCCVWNPDDKTKLYFGHRDGFVKEWDVRNFAEPRSIPICRLPPQTQTRLKYPAVTSLSLASKHILVGSEGTVSLYSRERNIADATVKKPGFSFTTLLDSDAATCMCTGKSGRFAVICTKQSFRQGLGTRTLAYDLTKAVGLPRPNTLYGTDKGSKSNTTKSTGMALNLPPINQMPAKGVIAASNTVPHASPYKMKSMPSKAASTKNGVYVGGPQTNSNLESRTTNVGKKPNSTLAPSFSQGSVSKSNPTAQTSRSNSGFELFMDDQARIPPSASTGSLVAGNDDEWTDFLLDDMSGHNDESAFLDAILNPS